MKNIKIRSIAILGMGLVLGASAIAGCSLVTTNYTKYYDEVAARVEFENGEKIEITRKDLRTAYASYGFNQYLDQGLTQEEAYIKTLDFLVSRKLAVRDAEIKAREKNANDQILTSKEKTYLFESTYEAMKNNISTYLSTTDSESNDDSNSDDQITREKFERKAELKYDEDKDEYSLILPEKEKSGIYTHVFWSDGDKDASTDEGKDEIFTMILDYIKDNSAVKDAYNKYFSAIKASEKELKLSTDAKSVFKREIERIYGLLYDAFMVSKYTEYMASETTNNVLIEGMLKYYSSKVRADYATYYNADQAEKIKENSGGIYYFNDGISWFYVSHILVKFDDTTKIDAYEGRTEQGQYDYLTSELEKIGSDESKYQYKAQIEQKIEELYNNLTGIKRAETSKNSGVYEVQEGVNPNAAEILKDVKLELNSLSSQESKAKKFDDLIYIYNEDPGMLNASFDYVVGVDYKKPSTIGDENVNYTAYSNWVEEFNKAAVSLYNNGEGQVGDLYDGLIRSNYGVHIMMYAGQANNLFSGITPNFQLQTSDIVTLYNAKLKQGTEKTYFDLVYENCIPSSSSIFQDLDNDRLTGQTKSIEYFKNAF